jgi:hypothetical protein
MRVPPSEETLQRRLPQRRAATEETLTGDHERRLSEETPRRAAEDTLSGKMPVPLHPDRGWREI